MNLTTKLLELSGAVQGFVAAYASSTAFRFTWRDERDGIRVVLLAPPHDTQSTGVLDVVVVPTDSGKVRLKMFLVTHIQGEYVSVKDKLWGLAALQRLAARLEGHVGEQEFELPAGQVTPSPKPYSPDGEPENAKVREEGYIAGHRAASLRQLKDALRELDIEQEKLEAVRLVVQLEQVRSALRRICVDHGCNDWPDDANLADVIEKRLGPLLEDL